MRLTKVGTPVTSSDRENAQLSDDDGGTDSSCDFLRGLDTETNVALRVTDNDNGLETGTLTGTGLLLDGFDLEGFDTHEVSICAETLNPSPRELLGTVFNPTHRQKRPIHIDASGGISVQIYLHDLILQLGEEEINDLVLLDGQGVEVDLLHAGDLSGLYETAELGDGLPFLLLALVSATTAATSTTASSITTTVAARTESSTSTTTGSVSHVV